MFKKIRKNDRNTLNLTIKILKNNDLTKHEGYSTKLENKFLISILKIKFKIVRESREKIDLKIADIVSI